MTRRFGLQKVQLTSHLALMPMRFWDYAGEWSKNVTTLDNEDNVVNFEVGKTAYFDGEEFARSERLVQVDGPGEPTGMVTIASVDRSQVTVTTTIDHGSRGLEIADVVEVEADVER